MNDEKTPKFERDVAYREAFLADLSTKLATPRADWPATRCWTMPSLHRIFRETRDQLAAKGLRSNLSNTALLEWLSHMRIARAVATEGESFHVLELGAPPEGSLDPLELLMAARPNGVICYFSSVAFHSLTTQHVAHHHVAILENVSNKQTAKVISEATKGKTVARPDSPGSSPPRLGQLLFRYAETPYYVTRRSARLVPGVQLRVSGPRLNLRITTYEQTLLDTLYKPFHCGGPEVVFEAWEEAHREGRVDEEWLADYFLRMSYPATARRTAVMFRRIGHIPGQALRRVLDETREAIQRESAFARISLLPGVEYKSLDEEWLVHTP